MVGCRVFIDLADEIDLWDKALRSWFEPCGLTVACVAFVGVVEVNKVFIDLPESVELEPVPELSTEDAVGSFDGSLVPGFARCGEDGNDPLFEQEQHHAIQDSRPGASSSKGEAVVELNYLRLLKAAEEGLTVLYDFIGRLRLNTLEMFEFAGKSERESNEVHRLGSPGNELLPDEVDLKQALTKFIDRLFGIMQIPADTFAANLRLER